MSKFKDMNDLFNVGDIIYGFCNGYFGRDDYNTKRVVLINKDYVLFEYVKEDWCDEYKPFEAVVLNRCEFEDSSSTTKEDVMKWKIKGN